jgi:hypothetical protein
MSDFFEAHASCHPEEELFELAVIENTKVYPVEMEWIPSPINDIRSLIRMYSLIKSISQKIIHTYKISRFLSLYGYIFLFFLHWFTCY